jgi:hypothetical protein
MNLDTIGCPIIRVVTVGYLPVLRLTNFKMKHFLIIFILVFTTLNVLGQQLSMQRVDSLLQGTWKDDSSKTTIRFDCHRKDTIVAYGILDPEMQLFTSFKLVTDYHYSFCKEPRNGIYYLIELNYTNYQGTTTMLISSYEIINISNKQLYLYALQGSSRPECKLITYSKIK